MVFTFDDGGESFLTVAAPVLEKYGFKGLFFISTQYIGTPGFLTREQIKELDKRGHIIGSHTHSHPEDLSKLTVEEVYNEWKESARILSSIIGHPIETAGIPNGNGSDMVFEEAQKCGITQIYTSIPTTDIKKSTGRKIYGRYVVRNGFSLIQLLKITDNGSYRSFLKFRYKVICVAKMILGSYYKKLRSKL